MPVLLMLEAKIPTLLPTQSYSHPGNLIYIGISFPAVKCEYRIAIEKSRKMLITLTASVRYIPHVCVSRVGQ